MDNLDIVAYAAVRCGADGQEYIDVSTAAFFIEQTRELVRKREKRIRTGVRVEEYGKYAISGGRRTSSKHKRRLRRVWKHVARAEQKKDCEGMKND